MSIAVFISHSSDDEPVATALARLLEQGIGLSRSEIRCTSATGYRIPVGVDFDDILRSEVVAATVFIGLVTPRSLGSTYVLFEHQIPDKVDGIVVFWLHSPRSAVGCGQGGARR